MTKTAKIIWTTAALLGAVSLFFNFREIPQETPPPLKNGEFLCPPDKQAEADRLKPPRRTAEEIGGYARLIENAPSPTEAWRLAEEARKKAEAYCRAYRVRRYPYRTSQQSCRRAERIPGLRFYRLPRRSKERPADRAREAGAECACYRP